jgi:glycosyltransferase involved in cell wall biosynthesis
LAVARKSDVVVAGNQYLADLFTSHGTKKAVVLPTVVEVSHYAVKSHAPTRSPTLVWIGSKSTLPYVRKILPALGAAAQQIPGLNLIIIADDTISHSPLPITHIPWSADTEAKALCRGDIGIAPTPEDRWTLGKCGFKIVQYMAAGLPVVASPVGANRDLVVQDKTGFLPTGADELIQAVIQLSKSDSLRSAMGQAGRNRVEEHYSIERAVDVWADLLK